MRKALAVLLLILSPVDGAGQQSGDCPTKSHPCAKTKDLLLDSEGCPFRLTSEEMMSRVLDKYPINRPGVLGRNNVYGVAEVEVVVDKRGKVKCARSLNGNPIGQAAAVRSVAKWRFKPYTFAGKKRAVLGVLNIPFDFR